MIVKCLVWSVALYGCETWTLRKEEIWRLNSLEMWIWRKKLKICWKEKQTSENVLQSVEEKRSLVDTISRRKENWLDHIMTGEGLLRNVIEGRLEGKRSR